MKVYIVTVTESSYDLAGKLETCFYVDSVFLNKKGAKDRASQVTTREASMTNVTAGYEEWEVE